EIPVIDSLGGQQMLVGVLMSHNGDALSIEPRIAVRMVEMPVGVDQISDRIAAQTGGRLQYPRARGGDAGVDEHLAVATGPNRNVAARALEDAHVATQVVDLDGRLGGLVTDKINDAAGLRVGLWRAEPATGRCKARCSRTTDAETAT